MTLVSEPLSRGWTPETRLFKHASKLWSRLGHSPLAESAGLISQQMMHENGRARHSRRALRYNTTVPAADYNRDRSVSLPPTEADRDLSRPRSAARRAPIPSAYIDFQNQPEALHRVVTTADGPRRSPSSSETELIDGGNLQAEVAPLQLSSGRWRSISPTVAPSVSASVHPRISPTARAMVRPASTYAHLRVRVAPGSGAVRSQQREHRDRSQSPPRSHSQAWLDEYQQGRQDDHGGGDQGGTMRPLFDVFLDDVRRRPWRYTSSSETQATITDPVDDSASTVTRAVERAYRMSRRPFTDHIPAQTEGDGQPDGSTLRPRNPRRDGIVFDDWDPDDDMDTVTYNFSSVDRGPDLVELAMARQYQFQHQRSWMGNRPPSGEPGDLRNEALPDRSIIEPELNDPDEVYGFTDDGYITVSRIGRASQSGDIEHIIV